MLSGSRYHEDIDCDAFHQDPHYVLMFSGIMNSMRDRFVTGEIPREEFKTIGGNIKK